MNRPKPLLDGWIRNPEIRALRGGLRKGELSMLTGMTLFFRLDGVYKNTLFQQLIDPEAPLAAVNGAMIGAGILTELVDRPLTV